MKKVKLFGTSNQNDDFIAYMESHPKCKGEEDDEVLECYINDWLEQNPNIEIIKISEPLWFNNQLIVMLWYEV